MKRLLTIILSIGVVLSSGWLASQNNTVEISADVQAEPTSSKNWQISPISVTVKNVPDKSEKNANSLGEVYFKLSSSDDLGKYSIQLVRLPGFCVIGAIECPQPEEIQTPFDPQNIDYLDWSPDGKKAITFESFSEEVEWGMRRVPPSRIYIFDVEEETWTQIFETSQHILDPGNSTMWSPDGKWIAFVQSDIMPESGKRENEIQKLFVIRPDGSDMKMLFSPATHFFGWSGENLLLQASDHPYDSSSEDVITYLQNRDVISFNPETGETTVLFKPDRYSALYPSPNGKFLAFADPPTRPELTTPIKEIRLFDPSGKLFHSLGSYNNNQLYSGIYPVSWSADSNLIAYRNLRKMYISKPLGQPVEVYQLDDTNVQPSIYNAVFSPDGSYLLMEVFDGRLKLVAVSADGKKQHEVTWSGHQEAETDSLNQQPSSPSWRPIVGP